MIDLNRSIVSIKSTIRIAIFQFQVYSTRDVHHVDPFAFAVPRTCIAMSAGVLLLADTIPGLSVSVVAPFLPFYIRYVAQLMFTQQTQADKEHTCSPFFAVAEFTNSICFYFCVDYIKTTHDVGMFDVCNRFYHRSNRSISVARHSWHRHYVIQQVNDMNR